MTTPKVEEETQRGKHVLFPPLQARSGAPQDPAGWRPTAYLLKTHPHTPAPTGGRHAALWACPGPSVPWLSPSAPQVSSPPAHKVKLNLQLLSTPPLSGLTLDTGQGQLGKDKLPPSTRDE